MPTEPTKCYRCGVILTHEYGWKNIKDSTRWHSYAAESEDCCNKCCRELERIADAQKAVSA